MLQVANSSLGVHIFAHDAMSTRKSRAYSASDGIHCIYADLARQINHGMHSHPESRALSGGLDLALTTLDRLNRRRLVSLSKPCGLGLADDRAG